jgi:methionyl-tRNA formyltransferase
MRVVFAGTPPFAATALAALVDAGHSITLVCTQPDRPAGRGLKLTPSAVAQTAQALGLPLYQPERLRDPRTHQPIADTHPDVMVVAAYGLILPQAVLDIPRLGCLNIHGSLLPRWRGAAPVQRAIEAGDAKTGIGIMQMEAGLDTGPVLLEREVAILPNDTGGELMARLATVGAEAIVAALADPSQWIKRIQATDGVTYAHKIRKAEASLDWQQEAHLLERRIRAFDPFPGTEALLADAKAPLRLKIWRAQLGISPAHAAPGSITAVDDTGVTVATGAGELVLTVVQVPGQKRQPAAEWARNARIQPGSTFIDATPAPDSP